MRATKARRTSLGTLFITATVALAGWGTAEPATAEQRVPGTQGEPAAAMKTIYGIDVVTIEGETIRLDQFAGKALLIVNVASRCGFTKQYAGLQALYERYKDRGFEILGFPSNDFMRQEPGTSDEIRQFCTLKFGVTFPMFEKIKVKGKEQHPLYATLTSGGGRDDLSGPITWNFNKFLIGRNGEIVARFGSRTVPDDPALLKALEAALTEAAPE